MIPKIRHNRLLTILHTVIIYAWTVMATIGVGIVAIITSFFSKTGDSVHHAARMWGKSILWISGIQVQVSGLAHVDARRSYIYMSNHQSNFDIPVLLSKLPGQFRWLAKAELFKIPIFGRSMRSAGYISIDRSNRKAAFMSLARAAEMIRNGTSVLIFPEGTRSKDGMLLPFKKGGFVLTLDAGVPIVPIVIQGTHDIMPKKSMLIQRRPVHVQIRRPIDTTRYTRQTKEDLMAHVRAAMSVTTPPTPEGEVDA